MADWDEQDIDVDVDVDVGDAEDPIPTSRTSSTSAAFRPIHPVSNPPATTGPGVSQPFTCFSDG